MSLSQDLPGRFRPDDTRKDGLERYQQQSKGGAELTSAPPGQRDLPTIWGYYSHMAEHYDKDLVKDANNTVEALLIFAGLFSAVVTGFISLTYAMLKPDPNDILMSIYNQTRYPGSPTLVDEPFTMPPYAIRVNCFLFAGLFTSMLVAMLGILVKQWTRSYERELAGVSSHHLRARIRHFRYNGATRWHLASIVGLLSIFMHLALFISAVGIIDLLLATAPTVGYVALSVFLVGVIFFFVTTILPLFVLDAPFRSPLSRILCNLKRRTPRPKLNVIWNLKHLNVPWTRKKKSKVPDSEHQVDPSQSIKEEEALDDHVELSQWRETEENGIVRTKILLDLDIICHLLSEADQSTDRWLLGLCFEKLPQLTLLARKDPDAFLSRKVIIEVYMFLARGCLKRTGAKTEIESHRVDRAIQLCKFLAWYATLPRTQEMRQSVEAMLGKNDGDPQDLPRTLATDSSPESLGAACAALGSLKHLARKKNDGTCDICESEAARLIKPLPTADINDTIKVPGIPKKDVTYLLVTHTVCLVLCDKREPMTPESANEKIGNLLTSVLAALERSVSKDRKTWDLILCELQTGVSQALEDAWFVPLQTRIKIITSKSTPGVPHEVGFTFPPSTSTTPVTPSGRNTPFPPQLTTPVDGPDNSLDSESTVASTPLIQVTDSDANQG